jgi:ankyrin repeat protein
LAKILIDEGIDIYQQDIFGSTPLHVSIVHKHEDIVKLFLEDEKLIKMLDNDRIQPLTLACTYLTDLDIIRKLCLKSNVNSTDNFNTTCLHSAVNKNNLPLIKILIEEFKVDITIRNGYNKNALLLSKEGSDIYKYLKQFYKNESDLILNVNEIDNKKIEKIKLIDDISIKNLSKLILKDLKYKNIIVLTGAGYNNLFII